jgi:hypothetical protein
MAFLRFSVFPNVAAILQLGAPALHNISVQLQITTSRK